MIAYKLFRVRKDGSIGSLFIQRNVHIPLGVWLKAESHLTKGYAFRPGWHCTFLPVAPHLKTEGRQWYEVEVTGTTTYARPESQGGAWVLAKRMRVLRPVDPAEVL